MRYLGANVRCIIENVQGFFPELARTAQSRPTAWRLQAPCLNAGLVSLETSLWRQTSSLSCAVYPTLETLYADHIAGRCNAFILNMLRICTERALILNKRLHATPTVLGSKEQRTRLEYCESVYSALTFPSFLSGDMFVSDFLLFGLAIRSLRDKPMVIW